MEIWKEIYGAVTRSCSVEDESDTYKWFEFVDQEGNKQCVNRRLFLKSLDS